MATICNCFMSVSNPDKATKCVLCGQDLNPSATVRPAARMNRSGRSTYDIVMDFRLVEVGLTIIVIVAYALFRYVHGPLS